MDRDQDYSKLININKKFLTFVHYWDTHKREDLNSPVSNYSFHRKELIDAILLLDKSEESKTAQALSR